MALKKELLDILVCPKCKEELDYKEDREELICKSCSLIYEVKEDIPIMLIDKAKPLASKPAR